MYSLRSTRKSLCRSGPGELCRLPPRTPTREPTPSGEPQAETERHHQRRRRGRFTEIERRILPELLAFAQFQHAPLRGGVARGMRARSRTLRPNNDPFWLRTKSRFCVEPVVPKKTFSRRPSFSSGKTRLSKTSQL